MVNNNKGITLIEVIISMSIVTLISFAFFTTVNNSIKNNKKNEVDIHSMNIAQSIIEEIKVYAKTNNRVGIDRDSDGNDDFDIVNNSSNWTSDIYNKPIRSIEVPRDNIIYTVRINKLSRDTENKDVYKIELNVEPSVASHKLTKVIVQIYIK